MSIGDWLARKYNILAQQAAADTTRADAAMISAQAAAKLDTTRAELLPTESAAAVALQRAQAALTSNQAKVVIPESNARIGLMGTEGMVNRANAGLIGENTVTAKRNNRLITTLPSSLESVMGARYPGFRLSD